jgi:TPR repeat protein
MIYMSLLKNISVLLIFGLVLLLSACAVGKISNAAAKRDYVEQDYARAFNALLLPAAHDNPEAQYALGYMYYYGLGIAKDQDIARIWIKKSADHHYLPALQAMVVITQVRHEQYIPLAHHL